jgi:multiple sugar transport system ATP-binding protein
MRTRVELAQLRQKVDAAVIMVTHDQAEAMTLADRIIVMNDRQIQQIGPPMEIYERPANVFVAQFVGSPAMTLIPAQLVEGRSAKARLRLGDGSEVETGVARKSLAAGGELRLGLRPENVRVAPSGKATTTIKVELVERLGERTLIYGKLSDGQTITAEDEGNCKVKMGDEIGILIDASAGHVFGADGMSHHVRADA